MRSILHSSTRRYLRHLWEFKATHQGQMLVASMVVAASISASSLDIPPYFLFCGLWSLGALAWLMGWVLRPTIRAQGRAPAKGVAGQPVTAHVTLTNLSGRVAHDVSVGCFGLPTSIAQTDRGKTVASLAPGSAAAIPVTLRPSRRGTYVVPAPRVFTTFPLNVCRTAVRAPKGSPTLGEASMLVLPRFHPLAGIALPVGERHQPGGIALSSHVGQSAEYIGNREYRPGDSTRRLDCRSWARLAQPVVKEYKEEYYCRIALVLDTYVSRSRWASRRGSRDLEAGVSLAASVADALARGEYIIDIFAAGPELYVFRSGRHTAHFENVLEILACVDACRHNPFDVVAPALSDELGNISTLVAVLLDWDGPREALVREAVEAGCSVKVLVVRDGTTSVPIEHADAAYDISHIAPGDIEGGGIEEL